MGILEGEWYYCPRCGFPNDHANGCCSECGIEFDEKPAKWDKDNEDIIPVVLPNGKHGWTQ